jgi:hypothetical protein
MREAGRVVTMREKRNSYRVMGRKHEGNWPLRIPRRRWEDDIKQNLNGVGRDYVDRMYLFQVRGHWPAIFNEVVIFRVQ